MMKSYNHYLVYKITNVVSGRLYIGVHKTNNINDRYFGSSRELKEDIKEHGISNFKKEILFDFDNPMEMYDREAMLVDRDFISRSDTYNKAIGGLNTIEFVNENLDHFRPPPKRQEWASKGRAVANANGANIKGNKKLHQMLKNDAEFREEYNLSVKNSRLNGLGGFAGKKHSDETKQKMSRSKSAQYKGTGNPNYGKKWMHDPEGKISKPIPKDQIDQMLTSGWVLGRIVS